MRILLASNYQWPHLGGIEIIAAQLKRCWEGQGHQVTWITTDLPRGGAPSTPTNIRMPACNWVEDLLQVNTPLLNPLATIAIRRLAREHDAVHVHSLAPGVTSMVSRAALAAGKPLVITQQVAVIPLRSAWLTWVQESLIVRAARRYARRGACLTFVSAQVRDWFAQRAGLNRDDLPLTPNAHDERTFRLTSPEERTQARRELALPDDRFRVLFVGRFYDKKGLHLVEALARRCPDVHFTLVGDGPQRPEHWGLPQVRVVSPQPAEQLKKYYLAHDLLVLPAVGEGWPLVICEAMACGTPCLISRDTFEKFGQDEAMFLVGELTPDSLLAALRKAQQGVVPVMRDHKRLADYATATWSWHRTAANLLDLFAAAKHPRPQSNDQPG